MPAAQLSKLKTQINDLAWLFTRPADFVTSLHDLLGQYTDAAYRPGQAIAPAPLLPTFKVPQVVIHQLEIELSPLCMQAPSAALAIVDALWADTYLETRKLGAYLLGRIPAVPPEPILTRIQTWASPSEHPLLQDVLLTRGGDALRKQRPDLWLNLMRGWLADKQPGMVDISLKAMAPLAADQSFENLPALFSLLDPLLMHPVPKWQANLTKVLVHLARRTPQETAYLLRTALRTSDDSALLRYMRKLLPLLPVEVQDSVKTILTEHGSK